jgi:integrase
VRAFSCHDLRYTGLTWLREAGVDKSLRQILAGHPADFDRESDTIHFRTHDVADHYAKVRPSTLRDAVAVFDEIWPKVDRRS